MGDGVNALDCLRCYGRQRIFHSIIMPNSDIIVAETNLASLLGHQVHDAQLISLQEDWRAN